MKRIMNRIQVFQLACLAVLAVLCGGCYFTLMTATFGGWVTGPGVHLERKMICSSVRWIL